MSIEENKAVVNRVMEMFSTGNTAIADEIIASDFVNHQAGPDGKADRESFIQAAKDFQTGFSNTQWNMDDMIAEGDRVAIRCSFKGTHIGEFMGVAATNKIITSTYMVFLRINDGKVVERWMEGDALNLLTQLGVISPPSS